MRRNQRIIFFCSLVLILAALACGAPQGKTQAQVSATNYNGSAYIAEHFTGFEGGETITCAKLGTASLAVDSNANFKLYAVGPCLRRYDSGGACEFNTDEKCEWELDGYITQDLGDLIPVMNFTNCSSPSGFVSGDILEYDPKSSNLLGEVSCTNKGEPVVTIKFDIQKTP